ncbi:MAG TPA: IS66 family insertion sequence element accessory protein TnpB [Oligoflexus sp.]|jgi:hypothetical protein|uniref:IS66 family insertion sequence element accessory protein TnpB n=1 Tax=Oligoflexus sp. TaxID=1971216 RepID=UPI002D48E802|nr:IS66 family insertion sequence element accessory protein TnpB [Oligoflexus sp.]HYX32878.1 IS66 family insertion sequence element accessory protein TnpB [Oligoflexus sp.]
MFLDPRSVDVFIYKKPIDCRKAHAGLVQLVNSVLLKEIRGGAIFLFVSRDRKTAKALRFDGSGLAIYHKKMERGKVMQFSFEGQLISVSADIFMSILSGAEIRLDLKI